MVAVIEKHPLATAGAKAITKDLSVYCIVHSLVVSSTDCYYSTVRLLYGVLVPVIPSAPLPRVVGRPTSPLVALVQGPLNY
jgi:VIT1/CCC1 family predicted Fe2+/Mn2+ transporter